VIVELHGLEVFGRHGAYPEEAADGQSFWFDVQLEVGGRGADDDLAHAVDYTEVAGAIRALSDARRFQLLEALADAVAGDLLARFAPERVTVRVRKRPAALGVEWSAATVTKP
jgi:dihydroneopterin aldolase